MKRHNASLVKAAYQMFWHKLHQQQLKWIEQCGGDLAGYINNYHGKYGRTQENAKAIYDADVQELQRIKSHLKGDTK